MLRVGFAVLLVFAACSGGGNDSGATTSTGVSNNTDDGASTPAAESGKPLLDHLLEKGNEAVYAAGDDAGVEAAFAELSKKIAAATSITNAMIDAEIEVRNGYVASLHSGETRVYPDQRTMAWMMGVVDALRKARSMRAE